MPRPQRTYSRAHGWLFRHVPLALRAERLAWFVFVESLQRSMTASPPIVLSAFAAIARAHLRMKVSDPELRDKLTPDYPAGCKRILFDADYLDALVKPNVTLITDHVTEITPSAIRTADGSEHGADVIVYGTGFAAADLLAPIQIRGLDGCPLSDAWVQGARAHNGVTVPGFPNLMIMFGPNTALASGSIIAMLEPQARYIRQAVQLIHQSGPCAQLDVRPDVEQRYDADVQARLTDSLWTSCASWYRNASGRVVAIWPGTTLEYRRRTSRFDPRAHTVSKPAKQATGAEREAVPL